MSYFKKTISGLSWTSALWGAIRVSALLRIAILARLLSIEAFGAFGVATLVLSLLEILTETGINPFLLQEGEDYKKYLNTAWVISIIRGIFVSLLLIIVTPYVAAFFNITSSIPLLYIASLIPIIRGFINPACIKFQKDLQFHKEFYYRFSIVIIEIISSIIIVWFIRNASGMVWALAVSALAEVALSFLWIKPHPVFSLKLDQVKQILDRGKWITGFGILDYTFSQGDNIVVGRMLGASALGLYQNAYKISTLPLTGVSDTSYKVTFPVYVEMLKNPKAVKIAIIKHIAIITPLLLVISSLVFIYARPITLIVLGSSWLAAVPIVKVLAFLGAARGISFSMNSLFMALKLQKYVTLLTLINVVGLFITIFPAVRLYGPVGAGMAATFGAVLALPFAFFFAIKLIRTL